MSAAKHTPGPWRYDAVNHQIRTGEPDGKRFSGECVGSVSPLCPEMVANAFLIAAAPELLEACREIFLELDGRYDGAPDSRTLWMGEHLTRLRAAIAKAGGGGQ